MKACLIEARVFSPKCLPPPALSQLNKIFWPVPGSSCPRRSQGLDTTDFSGTCLVTTRPANKTKTTVPCALNMPLHPTWRIPQCTLSAWYKAAAGQRNCRVHQMGRCVLAYPTLYFFKKDVRRRQQVSGVNRGNREPFPPVRAAPPQNSLTGSLRLLPGGDE